MAKLKYDLPLFKFNSKELAEKLNSFNISHPSSKKNSIKISNDKLDSIYYESIFEAFEKVYSKYNFKKIIDIEYDLDYKKIKQQKTFFSNKENYRVINKENLSSKSYLNFNLDFKKYKFYSKTKNKILKEHAAKKQLIYDFFSLEKIYNGKIFVGGGYKCSYLHDSDGKISRIVFSEKKITSRALANSVSFLDHPYNTLSMLVFKMKNKSLVLNNILISKKSFGARNFKKSGEKQSFRSDEPDIFFTVDINNLKVKISDDFFNKVNDKKLLKKFSDISNTLIENSISEIVEKDLSKKEKLKKNKDSFFSKFDKNGNGEIDTLEEKGFDNFLKRNQKAILDIDRNLIQDFVKLSKFLKDKQANLEKVFSLIRNAKTNSSIQELKQTFEIQHFSYCVSLFESYRMVLALIQDDMITFYELHSEFDELRAFESQWQKDLHAMRNDLNKIKQLNKASLQTLLVISSQIREMEISMIQGFNLINSTLIAGFDSINENLNQINDSINVMNKSLTKELKGINNKLWWNNLFQTVQIYQNRRRYNQLNKLIK